MKTMKAKLTISLIIVIAFLTGCATTMSPLSLSKTEQGKEQKIFLLQKKNFLGTTTGYILVVVGIDGIPRAIDTDQPLQGTYSSVRTDSVRTEKGTYPVWGGGYYYRGGYYRGGSGYSGYGYPPGYRIHYRDHQTR